ncbi:MAG: alpha-glucosidase/alpha-galactosidase [Gemmiger sp.]|nr:alpha-glucosidase/alpha-galactosidase [Gemmiger sp.]
MAKITFMGAGSSIFCKNVLGDCLMSPALKGCTVALFDIDEQKLRQSEQLLKKLDENLGSQATIMATTDRREALRGANYVINAIAPGAYDPYIIADFEIPQKYGLEQTVADTLGVGGLFRGLRAIPVMLGIARDMEEVCPDALLLNYTNPMCIVSGAVQRASGIRCVGLCHSVQVCAKELLEGLGMPTDGLRWKIGGINHQAWMLELYRNGEDIYPEVRRRAAARTEPHDDMVRYEFMKMFGYYVTESSSHGSEYVPYYHKRNYPELKEQYHLPTNGYKNWGNGKAEYWAQVNAMIHDNTLTHVRSREYASHILEAIETNIPYEINGNVQNTGHLISNLPEDACVEVPCLVDGNGIQPIRFGALPQQCAALNRTNINMQMLTIEAGLTGKREHVYQAAMLDPHTSAELSIGDIVKMCDELLELNKPFLPASMF